MLADIAPGLAVFCTANAPGCQGWRSVGGTSAAAPLVGGGLALIDQDLANHGRAQIGMANPLLYSIARSPTGAGVFSDVTQGSNDVGPFIPGGAGVPLGCCTAGPGFDEASGWGTIDMGALDRRVLTLLPKSGTASISIPGAPAAGQRGPVGLPARVHQGLPRVRVRVCLDRRRSDAQSPFVEVPTLPGARDAARVDPLHLRSGAPAAGGGGGPQADRLRAVRGRAGVDRPRWATSARPARL